jgi:hypothetical protein
MLSIKKPTFLFLALALVIVLTFDSILIPVSAGNFRRIPSRKRNETTDGLCHGTFSGQATFYEIGLGACGEQNTNDQLVAALPHSMFDPSPNGNPNLNKNCFRYATVRYGAKSVVVKIVDRCEGCEYGDIDLSPAAFCQLSVPDAGRINITYVLN